MEKEIDILFEKQNFIKSLMLNAAQLVKKTKSFPSRKLLLQQDEQNLNQVQQLNKRLVFLMRQINDLVMSNEGDFNYNDFDKVISINDQLLENVDLSIEKLKQSKERVAYLENQFVQKSFQKGQAGGIQKSEKMKKPQEEYGLQIDNSIFPFIPLLKEKKNAKFALDEKLILAQEQGALNYFKDSEFYHEFENPYISEIRDLDLVDLLQQEESHFLEQVDNLVKPQYESMQSPFPFEYIDSEQGLKDLVEHFREKGFKEMSIDVEHHQQRSYQGLTCLIQVSSREKDFIIDPFRVWQNLQILNELTTDPRIVKILHGANHDILWLQRDFGIYIVNMFDSGQGARELRLAGFGLGFLLKYYCKVESNKIHQLDDWRKRPLTESMIKYARMDTHFLFQIYDKMRKELVQKNVEEKRLDRLQSLRNVFQESQRICEQSYRKPETRNEQFKSFVEDFRSRKGVGKIFTLEKILEWRDQKARELDEGLNYVISLQMVEKIVLNTPTIPQAVRSLIMSENSDFIVQQNAAEIAQVILSSLEKEQNQEEKNQEKSFLQNKVAQEKNYQGENQTQFYSKIQFEWQEKEIEEMKINTQIQVQYQKYQEQTKMSQIIVNQQKEDQQKNFTIQKIKESTHYQEALQFMTDIYPQYKQIYLFLKEQEEKNKTLFQNQENNEENLENDNFLNKKDKEIERIEYMELPKPLQEEKKTKEILRLPDLKTLSQETPITFKRKRGNNNFGAVQKKNHSTNLFEQLNQQTIQQNQQDEDEEDEDPNQNQITQQFEKQKSEIKNKLDQAAKIVQSQVKGKGQAVRLNDAVQFLENKSNDKNSSYHKKQFNNNKKNKKIFKKNNLF